MVWASAEFTAMRASVSTCLLLLSASRTMVRCMFGHVPTQMASVSGA